MEFQKIREKIRVMNKGDRIALTVVVSILFVLTFLYICGFDVGDIILRFIIAVFIFGVLAVFVSIFEKQKKVAIEYPGDWDEMRKRILHRDAYTCSNCRITGTILHVHHVVPLSCGGTSTDSNLVTLCEDCHKAIHPHMR
jgi:hypothetical protein